MIGSRSLLGIISLAVCALIVYSPQAFAEEKKLKYEIVDLATLAEPLGVVQCEARKINEAGQVVGFEVVENFIEKAIYWEADGTAKILAYMPPRDNSTQPYTITEDGTALGVSARVTFEQVGPGGWIKVFMDRKAAIWQGNSLTDLNQLVTGGADLDLYIITGVNDAGQMVGFGGPPGFEPPPWWPNGFLFDNGQVTDLNGLQNPYAINNHGQIAGNNTDGQNKACIWENGTYTILHDHPLITGASSKAFDINDDGMVVGHAQMSLSLAEEPMLWIDGEPVRPLSGTTDIFGDALAVNNRGQVVGHFFDFDHPELGWRAFLWEKGEWIALNGFFPAHDGWYGIIPWDINDKGQIVGLGMRQGIGARAFLMTPIIDPLEADQSTLAASTGGTVNFFLHGETENSDRNYLMLGTSSGSLPGITLPGGQATLPLNWDGFTDMVLSRLNGPIFKDFLGMLDGAGEATAQLNVGPLNTQWVGKVLHFAYACAEPWDFASNAVAIEIVATP